MKGGTYYCRHHCHLCHYSRAAIAASVIVVIVVVIGGSLLHVILLLLLLMVFHELSRVELKGLDGRIDKLLGSARRRGRRRGEKYKVVFDIKLPLHLH